MGRPSFLHVIHDHHLSTTQHTMHRCELTLQPHTDNTAISATTSFAPLKRAAWLAISSSRRSCPPPPSPPRPPSHLTHTLPPLLPYPSPHSHTPPPLYLTMRVLAFFALLAAPALAFVPRMPAPVRARASLTLRFSGEYSEKVRLRLMSSRVRACVCACCSLPSLPPFLSFPFLLFTFNFGPLCVCPRCPESDLPILRGGQREGTFVNVDCVLCLALPHPFISLPPSLSLPLVLVLCARFRFTVDSSPVSVVRVYVSSALHSSPDPFLLYLPPSLPPSLPLSLHLSFSHFIHFPLQETPGNKR